MQNVSIVMMHMIIVARVVTPLIKEVLYYLCLIIVHVLIGTMILVLFYVLHVIILV